MESAAKSDEVYIGTSNVTKLGKTEKTGVFMKIDLSKFSSIIEQNIDSLMESIDVDDETIVNALMLNIKMLPLKDENILPNATHSVKAHLSLEFIDNVTTS